MFLYLSYEGKNGGGEWQKLKQWFRFESLTHNTTKLLLETRSNQISGYISSDYMSIVNRLNGINNGNFIDLYKYLKGMPFTDTIYVEY